MPYKSNRELPDNVKGVLPNKAQSIWRNVFNATERKTGETRARQQAWGAVKNAGFEKDEKSGRWRKVEKGYDPALDIVLKMDDEAFEEFLCTDTGSDIVKELSMQERINITKVDEDRRLVFGFFNINRVGKELVEDLQGDLIETNELEKAAYDFVLNCRVAGERHVRKGVGRLVESIMLTYEKQDSITKCLQAQGIDAVMKLGCEGWFGGFYIDDDDVWKNVKKGEYSMFSVGGTGTRIPLDD